MAKVDFLLTYWGDFDLFQQTVESVLSQDSPDWRLLVIDDCYPTHDAEQYMKSITDPRVSYHRHEENIGITNNFNYAIRQAKAEYCNLLGCDDILLPNYVSVALKNIGDADIYQPGVEVIDKNSVPHLPLGDRVKRVLRPKKPGIYSGEKLAASLCRGNWLYFPSILWKTETIKKYTFDPAYKIAEDVVVELEMICDGATLYLDNTTTFQYRRFADSLSSKEKGATGIRFDEENKVYDMFSNTFTSVGWKKAARAAKFRPILRIFHLLNR